MWEKNIEQEKNAIVESRKIVSQLSLNMKISDVEYQADGHLAIFYYIADARVDFRILIKNLANKGNSLFLKEAPVRIHIITLIPFSAAHSIELGLSTTCQSGGCGF